MGLAGFNMLFGFAGLLGLRRLAGFRGLLGLSRLLGLAGLLGFRRLAGFRGLLGSSHLLELFGLFGFRRFDVLRLRFRPLLNRAVTRSSTTNIPATATILAIRPPEMAGCQPR